MSCTEKDKNVTVAKIPENLIEDYFLMKTYDRVDGETLRKAWAIDKNYYEKTLSTTVLDYEHYSLHDKSHSENILNAISLLLGEELIKRLEIGDLWLLLEVAYCHDIGMALSYQNLYDLWTDDEAFKRYVQEVLDSSDRDSREVAEYVRQVDDILMRNSRFQSNGKGEKIEFGNEWPVEIRKKISILVAEYIRKNHAGRSREKIYNYVKNDNDLEPRLYKIVGDVSAIHGMRFDDIYQVLRYEETCFGDSHMHPQFVGALLRIGDLLDMDNNRFTEEILAHFGELPYTSNLHLKKHKALRHFNITPKEIMAEAESDDIEVCAEIARWYKWLAQENNDLITNWNLIAPVTLGGCKLSRCKLKVFLGNEEFSYDEEGTYKIDKKYAIDLLIGDNLYENKLDFIREYVQNALDASKVELENQLREQQLDYLLQIDDSNELDTYKPFNLKAEAFIGYTVKIEIDIDENDMLIITVQDRGTGIEEEDLNSLITIGRGWKGRQYYQDNANKMISWLKPTAGFGIGIQAAFMMSDNVEFQTKARKSQKGYIVHLADPREDGRVTIRKTNGLKNGTMVKITVPVLKFLDGKIYGQRNLNGREESLFSGINFLNRDEILKTIRKQLENYLRRQMVNSFIPVSIATVNGRKDTIFSPVWFCEFRNGNKKDVLTRNFELVDESQYFASSYDYRQLFLYDDSDKTVLSMAFHESSDKIFRYCFKGIGIVAEYEKCDFFSGMLDIMEGDVKNWLKMNRKEFVKDINKEELVRKKVANALLIYLAELQKATLAGNVLELKGIERENILFSCLKYLTLGEMGNKKEILNTLINGIDEQRLVDVEKIVWTENGYVITEEPIGSKLSEIMKNIFIQKKPIYVETIESTNYNLNMTFETLLGKYKDNKEIQEIKKDLDKGVMFIKQVYTGIDSTLRTVLDDNVCVVDCGKVTLRVYGKRLKKEKTVHEEINFDTIEKARKRIIINNPTKYEVLHINEYPFQRGDAEKSNNMHYIITPMDSVMLEKIDQCINNHCTYEEFFGLLERDNNSEKKQFERLIDWVYMHQCHKEKYSKTTIRKTYEDIIKEYYKYRKQKIFG